MSGLNEIISLMERVNKGILSESLLLEATRDEIYNVYYHETNGKIKKIPRSIFNKLCEIGDVDNNPNKMSEFSKWLCDMFGTPKYDSYYVGTYSRILKNDFKTFRKLQKIKPKGVDLNLRNYTLSSFVSAMDKAREEKLDISNSDIKKGGSETVYKDNEWTVVWIKSFEASLFYGKHTKWCTASRDDEEHFARYTQQGILLVFINKVHDEKYQLHIYNNGRLGIFCDETDSTQRFDKIVPENVRKKVLSIILPKIMTFNEESWSLDSENVTFFEKINDVYSIYENERSESFRIYDSISKTWVRAKDVEQKIIEFESCQFHSVGNLVVFCLYDENGFYDYCFTYTDTELIQFGGKWGSVQKTDSGDGIYLVMTEFGNNKMRILNMKTLSFVKIGGQNAFHDVVYMTEKFMIVKNFNEKLLVHLIDNNEDLSIESTLLFDEVKPILKYRVWDSKILMITIGENSYVYSCEHGVILKNSNIEGYTQLTTELLLLAFKDPEGEPLYKLLNTDTGVFVSYKGKDVFGGYETVANKSLIILYDYGSDDWELAFNTRKLEFSKAKEFPHSDNMILAFDGSDLMLFEAVDGEMVCFSLKNDISQRFPVEIPFKRNDKEKFYDKVGEYKMLDNNPLVLVDFSDKSIVVITGEVPNRVTNKYPLIGNKEENEVQ